MTKFKIDDRVTREIDIYDKSKGFHNGKVTKVYSKPKKCLKFSGTTYGPYPELYEVLWDEGIIEKGFLPHGLDPKRR